MHIICLIEFAQFWIHHCSTFLKSRTLSLHVLLFIARWKFICYLLNKTLYYVYHILSLSWLVLHWKLNTKSHAIPFWLIKWSALWKPILWNIYTYFTNNIYSHAQTSLRNGDFNKHICHHGVGHGRKGGFLNELRSPYLISVWPLRCHWYIDLRGRSHMSWLKICPFSDHIPPSPHHTDNSQQPLIWAQLSITKITLKV